MITFNGPIYCAKQQQTAIAHFGTIREAILPTRLPKQSLIVPHCFFGRASIQRASATSAPRGAEAKYSPIVPHCFPREQGGRKPVKCPHIWMQATVLKVFRHMWPIDFLENCQFLRFFNREVESPHMSRYISMLLPFDVNSRSATI
jgi:hypothetical protein